MKIGILGVGKMGNAILTGIENSKLYSKEEILLYDPYNEELKKKNYYIAESEIDLFLTADIIIIAIKPQTFNELYEKLKQIHFNKVIVSVAAGITISELEHHFEGAQIIRCMPNTPAIIGLGVTTISRSKNITNETFDNVYAIFESIGQVYEIKEEEINIITPINGSMPAFLYYFAKGFIDSAVKSGIDYSLAKKICANSIIGTSNLLLQSNKDIDELIEEVCSPKGVTLEGMKILRDNQLNKIVDDCSKACIKRSIDLSN